jgi:hypothetical protein
VLCPAPVGAVTSVVGLAGSLASVLANTSLFVGTMSCGTTVFGGPKAVIRVDLGEGTPVGGRLRVANCAQTTLDTTIHANYGCPTDQLNAQCAGGADGGCPGGGLLSSALTVTAWQPGDGRVSRPSALMDERYSVGVKWTPRLVSPIAWSNVNFLFADHLGLTRDPGFTDNILFLLLESPR